MTEANFENYRFDQHVVTLPGEKIQFLREFLCSQKADTRLRGQSRCCGLLLAFVLIAGCGDGTDSLIETIGSQSGVLLCTVVHPETRSDFFTVELPSGDMQWYRATWYDRGEWMQVEHAYLETYSVNFSERSGQLSLRHLGAHCGFVNREFDQKLTIDFSRTPQPFRLESTADRPCPECKGICELHTHQEILTAMDALALELNAGPLVNVRLLGLEDVLTREDILTLETGCDLNYSSESIEIFERILGREWTCEKE